MPSVVPKGNPDSRPLEVADDQVSYWESQGYVVQGGTAKKAAAKKTAKKSAAKKSS
jgi:DMSO/TMAO reductase YedYZ molybdopterin-dependent catalytic subunit